MLQGWVVVVIALAYLGLLFAVASYGDRVRIARGAASRLLIYPLSLAIYCTSWTFFGSVGVASHSGLDFLAIYIGPLAMVGLGFPLILRVVRLAKSQNITSIADFIAARYGKSQAVAATVALVAIVGMIPYIALQLKAVSTSVSTILAAASPGSVAPPLFGDVALFVALAMAAFAVLFGTRHTDATEHQDGLMLAIAAESIVKLMAFIAVGVFVTFVMFHGPFALFARARATPTAAAALTRLPQLAPFGAMTLLSLFAIMLLPRQFHVMVVENHSEAEVRRAAWLFPIYLVLINLFVLPIALAGLMTFPSGHVDSDMFVLALPLAAHSNLMTIAAFVGGLSAATAMVIVEIGRARHHGVERHRDAARAQAPCPARRTARSGGATADHAPHRDLRHPVPGLPLLSLCRRRAARGNRTVVVRGGGAIGAGFIWRPLLAPGDGIRRDRRRQRRHPGVVLHAAAAEHFRSRRRRRPLSRRRSVGNRFSEAAGPVRRRSAAAGAWRALEPRPQRRLLYRLLAGAPACRHRAGAGGPVRAVDATADCAELSAAPRLGDGRGIDRDRGALSRRRTHARNPFQASPRPAASTSRRRPKPISSSCNTPNFCSPPPSARHPRGWCSRSCCASARSRPKRH